MTGVAAASTRGEKTRTKLLAAGTKVFAANGYHATRVDDIVKAAATSHGTFYLYFPSKEALFATLVASAGDQMSALVDTLPPTIRDDAAGRDALRGWVGEFVTRYQELAPILRVWTESELTGGAVAELGDELLGGLARALAERVQIPARAGIAPQSATIATLSLVAMCERLLYYAGTGQFRATAAELTDTLSEIVIDALLS